MKLSSQKWPTQYVPSALIGGVGLYGTSGDGRENVSLTVLERISRGDQIILRRVILSRVLFLIFLSPFDDASDCSDRHDRGGVSLLTETAAV